MTIKIDLSEYTAQECDELLAAVAERRKGMQPEISRVVPDLETAVNDPMWHLSLYEGGTILKLRHPTKGWEAYAIPSLGRVQILNILLNQMLTEIHNVEVDLKASSKSKSRKRK